MDKLVKIRKILVDGKKKYGKLGLGDYKDSDFCDCCVVETKRVSFLLGLVERIEKEVNQK